jgi:sodium-dependent dicarboxylate transporter 2/3/5
MNLQSASDPPGRSTQSDEPTEDRSRTKTWVGLALGPVLALLIFWLGSPQSPVIDPAKVLLPEARATAAIGGLMAVWWMTEAVPLPVTSLLPIVLFPLAGVLTIESATAPYASKFVFLFLGGFLVARAVERWNLHRRIALLTVLTAGTDPRRLIAGFMVATGLLSMWISNTAATVMMLPIGLSLVRLLQPRLGLAGGSVRDGKHFATAMMLGIGYAASIGGTATLVGTPTNLFLAGFAADRGITIGFGRWMLFAAPLSAALLFCAWFLLSYVILPIRTTQALGGHDLILDELRKLGRLSRGETIAAMVFLATALLWIFREPLTQSAWLVAWLPAVAQLDDTVIAVLAAISLFLIPVDWRRGTFALDWDTAATIPWGVLLLFGGGFSLAHAVTESGLAEWLGSHVANLSDAPPWFLVLVVTTMLIFLTELTSNTPTVAAFMPILHVVALQLKIDPLLLMVPATLSASMAFMLPVATPPNAIVFGSGHVTIGEMARSGFALNFASIVLIVSWTMLVDVSWLSHAVQPSNQMEQAASTALSNGNGSSNTASGIGTSGS